MGVGYAIDLVVCSCLGVDMYDCVFPTRYTNFLTDCTFPYYLLKVVSPLYVVLDEELLVLAQH